MTMNEILTLPLALAAGILLGAFFFGGLWWTIRKSVSSARPAAWFLGSLLLRMITVLAGFYAMARGDWRRLLSCLLGFLLARAAVTRLTRARIEKPIRAVEGGRT
jgi:F1F0 ATPase subunit 2